MIINNENKLINVLEGLKENDKITIAGFNDFGMIQVSQTRFHSMEIKSNRYQTYIYLIHKPKHKRKYYRKSLDSKDIIILNGWHDIGDKPLTKTENMNGHTIEYWESLDSHQLKEIALIWEKDILYSSVTI